MKTYPFSGCRGVAPDGAREVLGGAATVVLGGGAGLERVGRAVGKLGSVGDCGLVLGVPSMLDWQPDNSTPTASRAPSDRHAFTAPRLRIVRRHDGYDAPAGRLSWHFPSCDTYSHRMLGKALDAFLDSPLSSIVPWALMAILAGPGRYEIAVWGALGFSLLVLVLDRCRNIPVHVLELLGVGFFVILAAVGLVASSGQKAWLEMWAGEVTNASLALLALASLMLGRPYTTAYARDVTPPDQWDTPLFKRTNMVVTAVWALAFGFSAWVGFLGDVVYGSTDNFWTGWILQLASLFFAVAVTEFYPEYARAKAAALSHHPVPSWSRVFEWLPPFVMATGVAGWLLATVSSGVASNLVVIGAFGTALLRLRAHRLRAT